MRGPLRWAENCGNVCNAAVATTAQNHSSDGGWFDTTYLAGNLSLLEAWAHSRLTLNYSGGGYFSTDGGSTWGGVDLPLPAPKGNGLNFGSDPTLAFDSSGNVFYGYIVVYFGNGNGINATAMAVARSTDGGRTYPQFTLFSLEGGSGHFNDKPMITADTNLSSPFRDNIYVAWDASSAAAGALMLGAKARTDIRTLLRPPQLR